MTAERRDTEGRMSHENIEIVRRGMEAWDREDMVELIRGEDA
jgi:hypothetical protein